MSVLEILKTKLELCGTLGTTGIRKDRVDSFDSILSGFRAKGGWLGSKIRRLSTLLVVNIVDGKQWTQSSLAGDDVGEGGGNGRRADDSRL